MCKSKPRQSLISNIKLVRYFSDASKISLFRLSAKLLIFNFESSEMGRVKYD